MTVTLLRAALFLAGLTFIIIGGSFLVDPAAMGGGFGLVPRGAQGLSSLRGDFFAYFVVAGGCLMFGAWKRRGEFLLVAGAIFGLTFLARAYSLVVDGFYLGWVTPMGIEAVTVILVLVASRILPSGALVERAQ
ncbi:MAG: DUF4345 family protein [Erythrobacter sp.]|uniref:DUF4345 family protein n=1 Tax=Erythrobacter sp. HL-111 TaxID=1798193 RepID=UPI0006DA6E3E|nr:DUF4345 family protein [Erythrobacter sp. HL-111]KPP94336.1 MAG: protein of unknown function containing DUF4345 domain [Erythrobacteraceae bacterium HL-111]SDS51287.1 protein of unknown function [Erythrobacter sp. HL-111]